MGSGGNSGGGLDLADTTVPEDTEIYHIYIVIYKGIKWIFYTFEYMNIENISTNGYAFMCTNISTYGFSQLERKLKKFY